MKSSNPNRSRCSLSVPLFLLLLTTTAFSEVEVRIDDIMDSPYEVRIHCRDYNDHVDLGRRTLTHKNPIMSFKFRPNPQNDTTYFCNIEWKDHKLGYPLYNYEREKDRCKNTCRWHITGFGINGFMDGSQSPDIVVNWPETNVTNVRM